MRAMLALLVLLAGCSGCASAPIGYEYAQRADFDNGICSSAAVGPSTILIATHCLKDGSHIKLIGGRAATVLARTDDGKDHSLLRLNIGFDHWARFGPYPIQGQEIHYYGNPLGMPDMLRKGYIVAYLDGQFFLDVEGAPGDSGAAVLDSEGRVIGVISMIFQSPSVNFRMMAMFPLAFTPKQLENAGN